MRLRDDLRLCVGHGGEVEADGDLENEEGEVADGDLGQGSVRAGGEEADEHGRGNLKVGQAFVFISSH